MSSREDLTRFYALKIDFGGLGLTPWGPYDVRYFCTPADAECFASVGVDGVHYCLLPGEETVYAVRPECFEEGRYVLPVAADVREFLSFLLFCGSEAAIEQIAGWDGAGFRAFLSAEEDRITPEQQRSLGAIAGAFGLAPKDPFEKIKALQAAFDPAGVRFSDEYYDVLGLEKPQGGSGT